MRFGLKNIGIVEDASVEVDGITVIAGENNTGKSTVTRAAFSVLNAFQDVLSKTHNERVSSVRNNLSQLFKPAGAPASPDKEAVTRQASESLAAHDVATVLVNHLEEVKLLSEEGLNGKLAELFQNAGIGDWGAEKASQSSVLKEILDILNTPDKDLFKNVLEHELRAEFANQICSVFMDNANAGIEVEDHGHSMRIGLAGDRVTEFNSDNFSFDSQVVYFDTHCELDVLGRKRVADRFLADEDQNNRRMHSISKLLHANLKNNVLEDTEACQKLHRVLQKLSMVCRGDIVLPDLDSGFTYQEHGKDKLLNLSNLSAGLKSFAILKSLLKCGEIKAQDFLIWDEPESHLHPKWQLLLAEVLVLLHKDFGLRILLTTNSPYFLRAITVFANKYEMSDKCKYYKTTITDRCSKLSLVDGDLSPIYVDLWDPFQSLEDVYWD